MIDDGSQIFVSKIIYYTPVSFSSHTIEIYMLARSLIVPYPETMENLLPFVLFSAASLQHIYI
jgi:hypothetical protein